MNKVFQDDFMFPTTYVGMKQAGMVLEGANCPGGKCDDESAKKGVNECGDNQITESADDGVSKLAATDIRSKAMSAALSWVAEGEFTYDAMDETVMVVADLDGDFEVSEEEEGYYNDVWAEVPDALATLGADEADVKAFYDGPGKEADDAAARMGKALKGKLDDVEADDEDIIVSFAAGEDVVLESAQGDEQRCAILEAAYKKVKAVRNGVVVRINKRMSGKVRLSAAQRAGLKMARRKAHTAAAKLARRKSMKIRKMRGM